MIPKRMETFLKERLPERTWKNRLVKEGGLCFMEFGPLDIDRLARLGIGVDKLGPHLVVCMWDEESPLEIGGYLIIDNLAMGSPSMGGIRLLPDLNPATTFNLARCMTLKNAAANLPYGGGKLGMVTRRNLTPDEHFQVVLGAARLIYRYRDIYLPGPDVGTNDADMKIIAIENGLNHALSKPADMGGNQVDQLGAAGFGMVIALEALLEEMPHLKVLPQFDGLKIPKPRNLTVLIQGFGAVGAHIARILNQRIPEARTVGVSDALGYLYDESGLPIETLFRMWQEQGLVTKPYYVEGLETGEGDVSTVKYSTAPNDLLRESAFCMIPAAPMANYLDIDPATQPSITVDKMGHWSAIIEGSNTYSPEVDRKAARARLERLVYRQLGVLIATDYLVNSGGVIFAAQEQLIKTPKQLYIPDELLGNKPGVEHWLVEHAAELKELAEQRRMAGESHCERVIRQNIHEFVELLISDPDMLPCEAAEQVVIRRIAAGERDRTAVDILVPIPTIEVDHTVQEAAACLVDSGRPILAVVTSDGGLAGVITEWDITRATAQGSPDDLPLEKVMSGHVISAAPTDSILEMVRKLEHYEISAMPVVDKGCVLGMISADLLARRSLLGLLHSENG